MLISIAIPCYRSEKNLEFVVNEIKEVFTTRPEHQYQIVLVNDGSPDNTAEVIKKLCAEDSNIVGVLLSRNFTQANAKMAALPYVEGDVLIFMDDDGQHPAEDIFKLADKITEGYDVVYAHFAEKKQRFFKIWTSKLYGWFSVKVGNRPKGIKVSSFLAYSRFAVDMLQNYKSSSPSLGGYLYSVTTKFANVESQQRKRKSGKSGYSLFKMINLAVSTLTNFTVVPLRVIDVCGILSAFIGLIYGIVLVVRKLAFGAVLAGYTSNMVVMLILGGMILFALGLVGEYVGRMYMVLSNKPQYIVRELINAEEKEEK